jgi:hypothetical protein
MRPQASGKLFREKSIREFVVVTEKSFAIGDART